MIRFLSSVLILAFLVPAAAQTPARTAATAGDRLGPAQQKRARVLLEQLGSPDFDARQAAARKIERLGKGVLPLLEEAAAKSDDPELRWQARRLARKLRGEQAGVGKLEKDAAPEGQRRRRRRHGFRFDFPGMDWKIDGFDDDVFAKIREHMRAAMKGMPGGGFFFDPDDMGGLGIHIGMPQGFGAPSQGKSISKAVKIEVTPDGVRVETDETKDGKSHRKVYEAPDMETLLEKHPELKGKVSGWSSRRRGRHLRDFGREVRDRVRKALDDLDLDMDLDADLGDLGAHVRKLRARMKKMLEDLDLDADLDKGLDKDLDNGGRKGRRIKVLRPEQGSRAKKGRVREPEEEAEGPRLGVYLRGEGLPETVRDFLGLDEGVGLWVDRVADGSIAERAGLEAGDVVTKLDGRWIRSPADVRRALRRAKARVKVEWIRQGARRSATVRK